MAKRWAVPKTHVIWGGNRVQYENKVGTTERIHLLNLQGENNPGGVQKPSQNDHFPINVTCVETPT
jgi:hypothetical protein